MPQVLSTALPLQTFLCIKGEVYVHFFKPLEFFKWLWKLFNGCILIMDKTARCEIPLLESSMYSIIIIIFSNVEY
jgi:hypothetical protein